MRLKVLRTCTVVILTVALACALIACSGSDTQSSGNTQPGVEEAVSTATEAYVYGYPLVTMDVTRKQLTNVAVPSGSSAPMGQLNLYRTYPAVDNHAVTAPNADTLYTTR